MQTRSGFLAELMKQLHNFKFYPKYQFERRIDAFIGFFLPAVLETRIGLKIDIIWPEFPVRTGTDDHRTTNIDYACYSKIASKCVFIELKTDKRSIRSEQLDYYHVAMDKSWGDHIADIDAVSVKSREKAKYQKLVRELSEVPVPSIFESIYLAPKAIESKFDSFVQKKGREKDWIFLSLESFSEANINTEYPTEWEIVSKAILGACSI